MQDNQLKRTNGSNQGKNAYKNQEPVKLPERYLESGYYVDKSETKLKVNPLYIIDYPIEIKNLMEKEGGKDKNKQSQIRKYYDYCLRIDQKLNHFKRDYSFVEADVKDLIPKVTYARNRNVVSDVFVKFIEKNVNSIKDEKDYYAFIKHFEAIVAFMKKEH